jgi:hypothetical protein
MTNANTENQTSPVILSPEKQQLTEKYKTHHKWVTRIAYGIAIFVGSFAGVSVYQAFSTMDNSLPSKQVIRYHDVNEDLVYLRSQLSAASNISHPFKLPHDHPVQASLDTIVPAPVYVSSLENAIKTLQADSAVLDKQTFNERKKDNDSLEDSSNHMFHAGMCAVALSLLACSYGIYSTDTRRKIQSIEKQNNQQTTTM